MGRTCYGFQSPLDGFVTKNTHFSLKHDSPSCKLLSDLHAIRTWSRIRKHVSVCVSKNSFSPSYLSKLVGQSRPRRATGRASHTRLIRNGLEQLFGHSFGDMRCSFCKQMRLLAVSVGAKRWYHKWHWR